MTTFGVVAIGYLLGSIPFAFLLSRRWTGLDVRQAGSGNVGAANVLRTTGVAAAVAVMLLDVAKGAGSVLVADRLDGRCGGAGGRRLCRDRRAHLPGLAAVPRRQGRRDRVRRLLGADAGGARAVAVAVFVATVWLTRYVSLGSVVATVALRPGRLRARTRRRHSSPARRPRARSSCSATGRTCARLLCGHRAAHRPAGGAMIRAAVLGAGSWGTALAMHLARVGHPVRLWARDAALVADMQARRANAVYLPDVPFPPGIETTASLERGARRRGPRGLRGAVARRARGDARGRAVPRARRHGRVSATKGLELETLLRMSEVLDDDAAGTRTRSSCSPARASPRRSRGSCRRRSASPARDRRGRRARAGRLPVAATCGSTRATMSSASRSAGR